MIRCFECNAVLSRESEAEKHLAYVCPIHVKEPADRIELALKHGKTGVVHVPLELYDLNAKTLYTAPTPVSPIPIVEEKPKPTTKKKR